MEKLNVRLVRLDPQRVASFYSFGSEPETQALQKLEDWARPRGCLDDPQRHRIFGFNNPDPMPGSPNYGYEFWITIGTEVEPEGDMRILDFPGGLYAVLRLVDPFSDPYQFIPEGWKQLVMWAEDSPYEIGSQQCLEELLVTEETPPGSRSMDLYLPVVAETEK